MGTRVMAALQAAALGLPLAVMSVTAYIVLFVAGVLSIAFIPLGVGIFTAPVVLQAVRGLAREQRGLAARQSGVEIADPYRPRPADLAPMGVIGAWQRCRWLLADPATWRDLLWLLPGAPLGLVCGLLPGALLLYGLEGTFLAPIIGGRVPGYGYGLLWPLHNPFEALLSVPQGIAILILTLFAGPGALRLHAKVSSYFLAPTKNAVLARRVERLAETRAETVDARAVELRRIERDLHDGAQARLVALSMNIGMAEDLLRRDPEAALALLAEARQTSGQALTELRDLVRGIHPPVLAERGLEGAVRALALTLPLPVDVDIELSGRPEAPVESAAYFAIAEVFANIIKHSMATRAWVSLSHDGSRLLIAVGDDGQGGADPSLGTGLRGVETRLSAFDGTMAVTSPPGGPTVVSMELPCALSSPKISPSSETA